jgi:WD40 repeat protein
MAKQAVVPSFPSFLARLAALCAITVMVGVMTPVGAQGAFAKITSANVAKLKMLSTLTGHTDNVLTLAFSPDSSLLASGSVDKTIRLWNVQNPGAAQPGAVLQGHQKQVAIVRFSADGKTLVSGGYDYTLRFWDVQAGKQTAVQGSQDHPGPMIDAMVNSFSPDMSLLLALANGGVVVWDVKKGEAMTPDALSNLFKVWGWGAFAPDGQSFYLADVASNLIYQIPLAGGGAKVALTGPDGTNFDGPLAVSPDGKWLAAVTSQGEVIHLFDLQSGKAHVIITGDQQDENNLLFSPDSTMLISSGGDSTRIWDVTTTRQVGAFPDKQLLAITFNADDTLIAVAIPQQSSTVPTKIELWGVPAQ